MFQIAGMDQIEQMNVVLFLRLKGLLKRPSITILLRGFGGMQFRIRV
jgi:hypothetical protein